MIITLHRAIVVAPQSMAAGAASLSSSPIRSATSSSSSSSRPDGQVGVVDVSSSPSAPSLAASRLGGPLVPGHEVTEDLLGDEQAVLQLGQRVGRAWKRMMWYEPSRYRSIGYASRRRPHGATLTI